MSCTLITGGFDPLHSGHIEYIKAAGTYAGSLYVGLNSDKWLIRKKGRYFMPFEERKKILESLSTPLKVIDFNDDDDTAKDAIHKLCKIEQGNIRFCNGGDRTKDNIPEQDEQYKNEVDFYFGIGGNDKKNSSSWILENYESQWVERPWGRYRNMYKTGDTLVKEFIVDPGKRMSYQRHFYRNELWFVAEGTLDFLLEGLSDPTSIYKTIYKHDYVKIPFNKWHQAINTSDKPVRVIETWYGSYLSEDDIERKSF